MGRARKRNGGFNDDLLSLLSPARQREILQEALGAQARAIVAHHRGGTFGALFDALKRSRHWSHLQKLSVSSVLRASGHGAGGKRGRPRGRRSGVSEGFLDAVVAAIRKHPGKRSEQLQQLIDGDRRQVKAALARLREQKRVRTSGAKRATTYTAV